MSKNFSESPNTWRMIFEYNVNCKKYYNVHNSVESEIRKAHFLWEPSIGNDIGCASMYHWSHGIDNSWLIGRWHPESIMHISLRFYINSTLSVMSYPERLNSRIQANFDLSPNTLLVNPSGLFTSTSQNRPWACLFSNKLWKYHWSSFSQRSVYGLQLPVVVDSLNWSLEQGKLMTGLASYVLIYILDDECD